MDTLNIKIYLNKIMKNKKIYIIILLCLIVGLAIWLKQNKKIEFLADENIQITESKKSDLIPSEQSLNLSNNNLTKMPDYVLVLKNLTELNISHNKLTGALPAEIRQLKNLKILRTNDNQMTGVPAEIGQLENLEILDLSNNQLTGLPHELANLKNLKTLNISGNNYSQYDLDIILQGLPANIEIIK